MLIITSDAEFHMEHQTELQLNVEVNLNSPASVPERAHLVLGFRLQLISALICIEILSSD